VLREASTGYQSTVQVIRRGGKNRQYYLICPSPLAQALEIAKGEVVEWVVEDKHTLILKRSPGRTAPSKKRRVDDE
jgi:bifunctional DNA-binding transcriptional regulator/antitoxin component of YhaV-PrlF toxin-antitoxin module